MQFLNEMINKFAIDFEYLYINVRKRHVQINETRFMIMYLKYLQFIIIEINIFKKKRTVHEQTSKFSHRNRLIRYKFRKHNKSLQIRLI